MIRSLARGTGDSPPTPPGPGLVPGGAIRFPRRSLLAAAGAATLPGSGDLALRKPPDVGREVQISVRDEGDQRAAAPAEACALPADAPVSARVDCTTDVGAVAGIRASLDARADALERGDRDAFLSTLDLRNPTWRRIQAEYFDAGAGAGRGRSVLRGTPVALQAKPAGYVRATIEFARAGASATDVGTWIFRADESGTWLHAEPLNDELGPRRIDDRGDFVLSHYDWDADIVDRVAAVAATAWAQVGRSLPLPTAIRPTISLNPSYAAHSGLRGSTTWAAYLPGSRGTVLLRSPGSYGAGTTAIGESADARLLVPLAHEMTHLVNDDIISIVRIPHWMAEGLAEHVADHMREGELAPAARAGRTWTLDKASDVIEWGTDPARDYTPSDVSMAYAHAAHGVRYFVERFGMEAFWSLAREYAESRRWEVAFQMVTGMTWEAFGDDWAAWVRARVA